MIGHRYDGEVRELFAAELVTDLDAYGVGNHRICDDLVERLLLFHDAQDGAKLAKILKLRLIEEVLRAGSRDVGLFVRARREASSDHGTAQVFRNAYVVRGARDFALRDLAKRTVCKARVERVGETGQVVGPDLRPHFK